MTLRELLAFNMKERRRTLGISQAVLAERADVSTHYIAMIELARKFPSPEILEAIATALEVETPELFSMPASARSVIRTVHRAILSDMEEVVGAAVHDAIEQVIALHVKALEETEPPPPEPPPKHSRRG